MRLGLLLKSVAKVVGEGATATWARAAAGRSRLARARRNRLNRNGRARRATNRNMGISHYRQAVGRTGGKSRAANPGEWEGDSGEECHVLAHRDSGLSRRRGIERRLLPGPQYRNKNASHAFCVLADG